MHSHKYISFPQTSKVADMNAVKAGVQGSIFDILKWQKKIIVPYLSTVSFLQWQRKMQLLFWCCQNMLPN